MKFKIKSARLLKKDSKVSHLSDPQVLLEGCKYIVKEKEVTRHITEDLDISFENSN